MTAKRLIVSLLLAVAAYAALAALWPVVAPAWGRSAAGVCEVMFARPGWGTRAQYDAVAGPRGPTLEARVVRDDLPEEGKLGIGLRERTYLPAALALALSAATPVRLRRRAASAAISLAVVAVFGLVQGWALAVEAVVRWPGNPFGMSAGGRVAAHYFYLYACEVPMTAMLVPVVAWGAAALPGMGRGSGGRGTGVQAASGARALVAEPTSGTHGDHGIRSRRRSSRA